MIITNLFGRLGNGLFEIAVGLYISKKLGVEFAIKQAILPEIYREENKNVDDDYYPTKIFPYEFFKKFTCLDSDYDISNFRNIADYKKYKTYKDFPLEDNLVINGWFLSKNYVNYEIVKDIYVPSKELKEEIFDLYKPTRNSLSINVRRGDFLDPYFIKRGWHSEPKEYWKAAFKFLNKKYDKILITSDDTEWCKNNLDFSDKIVIADKKTESQKIFVDLFLPTFVGDNIISASTFSWWSAYLNMNHNKRIIMPFPWNTKNFSLGDKRYYLKNTIKFDIYKCRPIRQVKK